MVIRTGSNYPLNEPVIYFDQVADAYDRLRSHYPAGLFDDIAAYAGKTPAARALEIGCGTGQATKSLANRAISIVCLEPGPRLAKLARRNFEKFSNVEIICSRFEDWHPGAAVFDLVYSANAIQWVDRKVCAQKTFQLLRPGGTFAAFRTIPLRSDSALERMIDCTIGGVPTTNQEPKTLPRERAFRKSGYFGNFERRRYERRQEYDAKSYVDLLSTFHRFQAVPAEKRSRGFEEVFNIIENHGGKITISYATHLFLARRKPRKSWLEKFIPPGLRKL